MTEIFAPYKWEALFARWPDILAAFGMTAAISALALVIALVLGFVFGVFAVSRFRILRALTRVYVETVQNIPLLLQVFVLYAVFPLLGLTIPRSGSASSLSAPITVATCQRWCAAESARCTAVSSRRLKARGSLPCRP